MKRQGKSRFKYNSKKLMDEKWEQLILNCLGPAYDDYEYFESLVFKVQYTYLPDETSWEEVIAWTLKLTRVLVENDWILVSDSTVSFTDAVQGTHEEILEMVRANWESLGFKKPMPGEVMIYELSQAGKDYYDKHEWKRIRR